ncbi:MAG: hypothetical protein JNL11_14655 [Bdellovibrionaceae bacterium]|nr:hypothetical protein [Pseudobdellovibrionaceae bacterium]
MDSLRRNWKKFLFILGLFIVFTAINEVTYYLTKPEINDSELGEAIAIVIQTQIGNVRKNASSELWTELYAGDQLYVGDSIRTATEGVLIISFLKKNQNIEIEPDSHFILQENAGKISLDVLEGKLLVKKDANTGATPGSVNDFIINQKSDEDNAADKQNASVVLKPISPSPEAEVFWNPEEKSMLNISWEDAGQSHYEIWLGSSRKSLSKQGSSTHTNLNVNMQPGQFFWQIIGFDKNNRKTVSDVYRFKVLQRNAPQPVYPTLAAYIKTKNPSEAITFSWRQNFPYEKVSIEISNTPDMSQLIQADEITRGHEYKSEALFPGQYFWRLKGIPKKDDAPVVSSVYNFTLAEKVKVNLSMSWDDKTETTQYFLGDQPLLNVLWNEVKHPAFKAFKIRLAKSEAELKTAPFEISKENKFFRKMKTPGRYVASIEALDDEGERIAYLPPRAFDLKPLPILAPVRYINIPDYVVTSDEAGNAHIEWENQEKAFSYRLTVMNGKGDVQKQESIKESAIDFTDLLPGSYKIIVAAIDQFGREGEKSRAITLVVPDENKMIAPKIKKLEVD